ncbi:hypothetical protein [Pseudomonas entomophila]|uniref:hypothetical protein n=1 Tax=Pseudomonas entomophila TaxID=312306 RepID=UPI003EB916C5
MDRIKVKIVTLGLLHLPSGLRKIKETPSKVFEIVGEIESYPLSANADLTSWGHSDKSINSLVPVFDNVDFTVIVTFTPLQDSYYTRHLGASRTVFSLWEISEILSSKNIPLENAVLRSLYQYSLIYKKLAQEKNPDQIPDTSYLHDETRGCLFDMNGLKINISASCATPRICSHCKTKLLTDRISEQFLESVTSELVKIKKPLYFRITELVKIHPILALFISSFFAIFLGILGSILASIIYDRFISPDFICHQVSISSTLIGKIYYILS